MANLKNIKIVGTPTFVDTIDGSNLTNNSVANTKLSTVSTQTIKGRTTAGTGNVEDLTATQATAILNAFVGDSGSGGTKGLVPAPASGDSSKFLKGDGTWTTISGSGVTAVGAIDSQTPAGNGLVISGTTIYAQSASASVPGLMNTIAQTFAGDKTFNGRVYGAEISNSTVHNSNSIFSDGGISAKRNIHVGNATSGQGGQIIFKNDAGTAKWSAGLDATAAAVDFVIYDRSNARIDMSINSSTGNATFFGSVTATSFSGDIDGGSF